MIRQSKTTIKELSAQYRSVLKKAFLAGVIAVATASSANATITASDISDINASINMVQSDGNYTTSKGDFNAGATDYSTAAGYGLYTYDHDNNPETPEIPLTTNNGTETLDDSVFTYTDNNGATTNLGVNSTGFTTGDFTDTAGTIDAADGTTSLATLEANTTTVGLGNYQYKANFDNTGDALTALTAEAPELSSFHNDITLTTGAITVTGNDEANKPSIDQYGFTVTLHDSSTGNFDLVFNENTHLYSYNYNGDPADLDATDIAAADAQVASKSADLLADTALFNGAVTTNTNNYNSAVGHYNNVHSVYESDTNAQSTLNSSYDTYAASFATAQANQSAAADNLSDVQGAYAADLAVYTPVATAYNNYENSLGKSIDAKDATVLADAKTYADGLATNYDAAGSAATAETNAKGYADSLAANYDAAGSATTAETNAKGYADSLAVNYDAAGSAATAETNAKGYADSLAVNYDAAGSAATAETNAKGYADSLAVNYDAAGSAATAESNAKGYADAQDALTLTAANQYTDNAVANAGAIALNSAKAYTDKRVDDLEKDMSAGIASSVALSSVAVSGVKRGEVSVGGGYGYFNGQSAVALGASMGLSDRWSVNAGAGISGSDTSFRAGTNYKFKMF